MENSNKGIWAKMQNSKSIKGEITLKDVEEACAYIQKAKEKEEILKQKRIENNLDWLSRKSSELGEPIPEELLVVTYTESIVDSKFLEKYKKWIT